jgi:hypothetical protein
VRLAVAGGFDERLSECHETLADLEALAERLGLRGQVTFLKSLSEADRAARAMPMRGAYL